MGATFFHQYEFVASDHTTALKLENANKYIYLFLATLIQCLAAKYSFNREINDKRIQKEKILLPVDNQGNPDWDFIQNYMKKIECQKITQILHYFN